VPFIHKFGGQNSIPLAAIQADIVDPTRITAGQNELKIDIFSNRGYIGCNSVKCLWANGLALRRQA
jgi:hypothetical protein